MKTKDTMPTTNQKFRFLYFERGEKSFYFSLPSSYEPCYEARHISHNGLRIKNRFNVFYTLLAVVRI